MEVVTPSQEILDVIKENGGNAFDVCYQCGMCDTVCPWNRVRNFSIRKIIRQAAFGLTSPPRASARWSVSEGEGIETSREKFSSAAPKGCPP